MEQIQIEVDFKNVENLDVFECRKEWASDPSQIEMLKRFISSHYDQDTDDWKTIDFDNSWNQYQSMINEAIKAGNLESLEILWQGIYWHDRDNPDYETDVYTAAEFANLKMFQHVLYSYMNNRTLNGVDALEYHRLYNLATKNHNPDVLRFIEHLLPSFSCWRGDYFEDELDDIDEEELEKVNNHPEEHKADGDYRAYISSYLLSPDFESKKREELFETLVHNFV